MKINNKVIDIFIALFTFAGIFIALIPCVLITKETFAHNKKPGYFNVILYPPNHEIVGFRTTHIDFPSAGLIEFYDMDSGDYVCLGGNVMVRSGE